MPVRSGVTVTDTSHLCQLNALMFLVCMQRATLKVITWSLVREQEVPLQQTLRLKVHRHRLDAVAIVAVFFFLILLFVLFLSSHCHVTKKFNAFLKFYFLDFQVYLQKLLSEKRNLLPYAWLILFKKCYVMKPSCQIYMKSGFKSTSVCSFSRDNDI